MGVLEDRTTNFTYSLSTRSTIGRASKNTIVLTAPSVSGVHASVDWAGDRWTLRDLGSRNGTHVESTRIEPYKPVDLSLGSEIAFGDTGNTWRFTDDGPPQLAARSASGDLVFPDRDVLSLPSIDRPELTLIREEDKWEYEIDSTTRFAVDQEQVVLASGTWTLLVPELLSDTTAVAATPGVSDLTLRFILSRDEEHIEIHAEGQSLREHFDHRAHFYLLLTLARLRLEDAERSDLPMSEHGWIERERLERLLRIDSQHLNLLVYRARRQFAGIGVRDSSAIVERRTGSSQLRIGTTDLVVVPPE